MPGKSILITGFDPFGGETINPAWEAVKRLPEEIGSFRIDKLQVPTVFGRAGVVVLARAEVLKPDAVICVGQAGGRDSVTPEMVAVNLRYAPIPDNAGARPLDEPVVPGGPAAYFATLPVRAMAERISAAGVRAAVSYSAGAFVCNDLMYTALHHFAGTGVRAGFIHVPFLPEQAEGRDAPSLPLTDMVRALMAALRALEEEL